MENTTFFKENKKRLGNVEKRIVDNLLLEPPGHYLSFSEIKEKVYKDADTKNQNDCLSGSLARLVSKGLVTKKVEKYKSHGRGGRLYQTYYTMNENNRLLADYLFIDTSVERKFLKEIFNMLDSIPVDNPTDGEKIK
jgi:predicted transcriptional regulator